MDLKSNEPFWLVKNGIIAAFPSLREGAQCDVLVVGGGITGALIAHQCVREGFDTILIDKREIANGSSAATTSMLQYEIDVPLYQLAQKIGQSGAEAAYKACLDSIWRLEEICKNIKSNAGFAERKSLYFARFKKDVAPLQEELAARAAAGFDVEWVAAADLESRFHLHEARGAILSAAGASVDAYRLVHELLLHDMRRSLRVYDRTELTNLDHRPGFNLARLQTGATIRARKTVFCCGYEATHFIKENFVDLLSTFAIVSEVNPAIGSEFPDLLVWNTDDPYLYMRTTDDGRILVGGADEEFTSAAKRDALISKKAKALHQSFHRHFPGATFQSDFAWAGTFGETRDGLPYIGTHDDFPGSYFVLGFGGNGITFSVIGMAMVADWLRDKTHPLAWHFRFGR